MKSLSSQDENELGGPWSVLARQKRDHVRLDELLHALPSMPGTEQESVLQEIRRLVFPHAFAEEAVLWPVIRRVLPYGEEITRQVEEEHQEVNELVLALDDGGASTARDVLLDRLDQVLREDVRDEEDVLLPRLQEQLTTPELRRLGVLWEIVRRVAPTRPHPYVSRRPPGNVLSALPLSVLDRARDRVESLHRRLQPDGGAVLKALSDLLASITSGVERFPPMRWGEPPSTRLRQPVRS